MNRTHYRAVVIGGGVVGVSVLYHLAKLGWQDVVLIERSELTAGSTWHAAAGFHSLNADPNVAALQAYTINLYRELEAETGLSCGLHLTGGLSVAGTPERWEWLQAQWAMFQTMGIEGARLVSVEQIKPLNPIMDTTGLYGGLFDSFEGHLDASGTTYAYAAAAKARGAEIVIHNRVLELNPLPVGGAATARRPGRHWRLAGGDRAGHDHRRPRRQRRRAVGQEGRPAWPGSTCRSPRWSTTTWSPTGSRPSPS